MHIVRWPGAAGRIWWILGTTAPKGLGIFHTIRDFCPRRTHNRFYLLREGTRFLLYHSWRFRLTVFFIYLIFCFHKIQFKLEYDKSEEKASKINDFCSYVYRRTVPSAPEENSHGCVGCQTTSNTPRSSCGLCAWSFLSGTINGFCSKSLKILNENKLFFSFLNVRQTLNLCWLTCTPFRVTQ